MFLPLFVAPLQINGDFVCCLLSKYILFVEPLSASTKLILPLSVNLKDGG